MRSCLSSSSSTTRILGAISDPFLLIPLYSFFTHASLLEREGKRYLRALVVVFRGIGERDLAAMVLGNLAHDGQAHARALRACCVIWFGHAVPLVGRQADTVVGDLDEHTLRFRHERQRYVPR